MGAKKGFSCENSPTEPNALDIGDFQVDASEGGQSLRPIVIDGSNVAMRLVQNVFVHVVCRIKLDLFSVMAIKKYFPVGGLRSAWIGSNRGVIKT